MPHVLFISQHIFRIASNVHSAASDIYQDDKDEKASAKENR
jgi:hypothetical protein